ncbi:protein OS-9 [Aspergillus pseudoustus]|uniref:Endoplasmic reticulum lectin n=1 Tax=Aspergillus pseudoustus TaxID=1810923 RepID=A0ABR4KPS8_9EURO
MSRQSRIAASLLVLVCVSSGALADRKFNIHDDLLAFPQYRLHFPDAFVLDSQARAIIEQIPHSSSAGKHDYEQAQLKDEAHNSAHEPNNDETQLSYEELILEGQRYLCQIPIVEESKGNQTAGRIDEEAERNELARATDRGLKLLSELEGKCLYYISGWWSYSFCYMNEIKQFHALSSAGGAPNYPPTEDPQTHSFILGRFQREDGQDDEESEAKIENTTTDIAELQTRGGSRYLVQHLEGGTQCDITKVDRKIEVQFHCNPQSADRIGWIKEVATCSYLMLIYTPRLCNDVAFLPPQEEEVHTIECREILTPEEVSDWSALQEYQLSQKLVESGETSEYPIIGGIEVGAQRSVGTQGRVMVKGRITTIGEEKIEIVAKSINGEFTMLSNEELKKRDLDPEKLERFGKKVEQFAKGQDWALEYVTSLGKQPLVRGVVVDPEDAKVGGNEATAGKEETQEKMKDDQKQDKLGSTDAQEDKVQGEANVREGEQEPTIEAEDSDGSEEVFKDEL